MIGENAISIYQWWKFGTTSGRRSRRFRREVNAESPDKNVKLGVGYNFTDFSDDLTDLSYRSYGWFINILGKF